MLDVKNISKITIEFDTLQLMILDSLIKKYDLRYNKKSVNSKCVIEFEFTEKQLSKLMYFMDKENKVNYKLKDYLQKAGENIFGWYKMNNKKEMEKIIIGIGIDVIRII